MRCLARLVCAVALLSLFGVPGLAGDDVTLEGAFVWVRDDGQSEGDLKAVFTPTGKKEEWNVAFSFDWEDGPHTYAGTAKGNLKKGSLEGEVDNDNPKRKSKFWFNGKIKDGTFNGKHGVIDDEGKPKNMGTLRLAAAAD